MEKIYKNSSLLFMLLLSSQTLLSSAQNTQSPYNSDDDDDYYQFQLSLISNDKPQESAHLIPTISDLQPATARLIPTSASDSNARVQLPIASAPRRFDHLPIRNLANSNPVDRQEAISSGVIKPPTRDAAEEQRAQRIIKESRIEKQQNEKKAEDDLAAAIALSFQQQDDKDLAEAIALSLRRLN